METKLIIQTVASVMTDSFNEDPMSMVQMEGIVEREKLFKALSVLHSAHALQTKSLRMLNDDPRAFLIGFDSIFESKFTERNLNLKILMKTISCLGWNNLKRIFKNMQKAGKVLNFSWHKDHINGRHFRIKIIAIDKNLRGSGAFRRLITPVLEYADGLNIPIVLETHNPSNIGLYEHFGFTLVKTISHPELEVKQYCMIRWAA